MDFWSHFSISESFFRFIFSFLAFGSQSLFFPALEGSNMPPHTILPCFMLFQLSTLILLPIHNPATSRASLARHPTPFFPALKVLKLLLITILLCFVFLQLSTLTLLPFIILQCLVLLQLSTLKSLFLISAFFVEICDVCIFCWIFGFLWNDSFFFLIEFCWLVIYDFEIGAAKTSKMNHGNQRCENQ